MNTLSKVALLGGTIFSSAVSGTPVNTADLPYSTPSFLTTIGFPDGDHSGNSTLSTRDIRGSLPVHADTMEHRFQPVLDFDKDGCYYTSAMDPSGNLNPGLNYALLGGHPGCLARDCREPNRLENNNVYSRKRCNNGWCAIMYAYYFEKDQVICGSWANGHRHDWEHIVVFIKDDRVHRVAPSCHGKYDGATNSPRIKDDTRAKVVYHKDGGFTHCFRMANAADDAIENYTGNWFLGRLVGWMGFPTAALRGKLTGFHDGAGPNLERDEFTENLRNAAGNSVAGFDPANDVDSYA